MVCEINETDELPVSPIVPFLPSRPDNGIKKYDNKGVLAVNNILSYFQVSFFSIRIHLFITYGPVIDKSQLILNWLVFYVFVWEN